MSEPIKFTEEELKKLKEIQKSYFDIQNSFGQAKIAKINLSAQMEDLHKFEADLQGKFNENKKTETDFVDQITKKYGNGRLNLESGTFIPTSENK